MTKARNSGSNVPPEFQAKLAETEKMMEATKALLNEIKELPAKLRRLEAVVQKVNTGVRTIEEVQEEPEIIPRMNAHMREVLSLSRGVLEDSRTLEAGFKLCEAAEALSLLTDSDAAEVNERVEPIIRHEGWSPVTQSDFSKMWIVVHEMQKTLLGFRDWEANTRAHRAVARLDLDPAAKRLRQGPALVACGKAVEAWRDSDQSEASKLSICRALTVRLKELDHAEFSKLTPKLVRSAFADVQGKSKTLRKNCGLPKLLLRICEKCGAWPDANLDTLAKK